ncbi:ABC transporter ATP-binding protein [Thalassococcus profundi]|uniref:ABC transporter ATP-binding protein n=1 Tax=Thalassococcus profundi TaxID=2282382 RepID=A0A369THU3_9RHOB|nr:ABC transporter ATP-binding protein [Thalassococcus profundi]RDD64402.1 ABC transporter ATP-binding protein [Thalassococcus profundi]
MIELRNLRKTFHLNGSHTVVADNINAVFPDRTCVAVLGRNGAGKSSLLQMLAGTLDYDSGEIVSTGSISWPVGFAGSCHPELTGVQNVRFVARVYGVETDDLVEFVRDFAELGEHFNLPVRSYSSGMKSRLAFGMSMGIKFDTYLVDEVTAVGDASFKAKGERLFTDRLRNSSAIMVTHGLGQVKRLCQHAAVLEDGHLYYYTDPQEAIRHHQELMKSPPPDKNRAR